MKPSEIFLSFRAAIRQVVESNRANNPRLFAFVLYGHDMAEKDLDLLVDPLPGSTLQDLGAIQAELEKLYAFVRQLHRLTCLQNIATGF